MAEIEKKNNVKTDEKENKAEKNKFESKIEKAVENKSVDVKSVEEKPVEFKPVESKPIESKPVQSFQPKKRMGKLKCFIGRDALIITQDGKGITMPNKAYIGKKPGTMVEY